MTWICRVCQAPATCIADFATSKANKQGVFHISRNGYCEAHKPDILTIEEYEKAMAKRDD